MMRVRKIGSLGVLLSLAAGCGSPKRDDSVIPGAGDATATGTGAGLTTTTDWVQPVLPFDCYAVVSVDEDNDGSIQKLYVEAHDPSYWSPVHIAYYFGDTFDRLDQAYDYTRDARGDAVFEEGDTDGDGTVDYRATYVRDVDGNLVAFEVDDDADGAPDRSGTYTLRPDGQRLRYEFDLGADGVVDEEWTYLYDALGRRERVDVDLGVDGVVDDRYRYTYDTPTGLDVTRVYDVSDDGIPEEVAIWRYDALGQNTEYLLDTDGDGYLDVGGTYGYDSAGHVVTWHESLYGPGESAFVDFDFEFSFRQDGKPSRTVTNIVGPGYNTSMAVETWHWTCPG